MMNTPDLALSSAHPSSSLLDKTFRSLIFRALENLRDGSLVVEEYGCKTSFGDVRGNSTPEVVVEVNDPIFWRKLFLGGTTGAAEAYMDGVWQCSRLVELVQLFVRNTKVLSIVDGRLSRLSRYADKVVHLLNRNTRSGSKRNISAHYDLGNQFFELMLDPSMMYSSAYYVDSEQSLEQAALYKLDLICQKLKLRPGDHVLEIGTGWGGFAEYAATHYSCRVTTTTISREQFEFSRQRIKQAGLEKYVTVLMQDYRDLQGKFDKIVSIEMIEAVGHQYLETYFRQCSQLLKDDGEMFLQAITIRDQYYESALGETDFIKRYIFPGGFLPSVSALAQSLARASDMKVTQLEDIGWHYAMTLKDWRAKFLEKLEEVTALGYSRSFTRMWRFYLCYCEGGFRENYLGTVQMVLSKPGIRSKISAVK